MVHTWPRLRDFSIGFDEELNEVHMKKAEGQLLVAQSNSSTPGHSSVSTTTPSPLPSIHSLPAMLCAFCFIFCQPPPSKKQNSKKNVLQMHLSVAWIFMRKNPDKGGKKVLSSVILFVKVCLCYL